MDNLDDSENNAKISDSGYSNSCSNSQSRRSHSSKSTHSGSHSSGSSGYSGKPSTSGTSNSCQQPKKEKDSKKKKLKVETTTSDVADVAVVELRVPEPEVHFDVAEGKTSEVTSTSPADLTQPEMGVENMDISTSEGNSVKDEEVPCNSSFVCASASLVPNRTSNNYTATADGFSCVISMHDGVVMYTTSPLTGTLGFPKDMWIGRSFIDFIHPKDRNKFASQITNGLVIPKIANGTQEKAQSPASSAVSTMVCRIRRYRGLAAGFSVKDRTVTYMPFLLKLNFKNISDDDGKDIFLVIQATPFFSAFKTSFEVVNKAVPFVIRHAANGTIEYVDPESVPYLGYLPQDLAEKDALQFYHPEDLSYLIQVYDTIVKEGGLTRSKPYRMFTHNGDYIKLETEWSSFINPWSKKLEFVIGKHHILEGPENPDVFQSPDPERCVKYSEEDKNKAKMLRESILRIMKEVLTKPAEAAKQQMSKRCQELATFMESLLENQPKTEEELRLDIQDPDNSYYERDSVMLGGISPHHDYSDGKSSTETPLSYNQLNYNENMHRYFLSHQPFSYEDYNTVSEENALQLKNAKLSDNSCYSPKAHTLAGHSSAAPSPYDSNIHALGGESSMQRMEDFPIVRLTETLLSKHNSEMEKELIKIHRETRSSSKGEREKKSSETRQKKKEHLARCNASFQPTTAGGASVTVEPHGVKRASKHVDESNHKHHCSSSRQSRRRQRTVSTSGAAIAQPSPTTTTTVDTSLWTTPTVSNMNTFILGVGIPQQMPLMSPVAPMTGMIPMFYTPATVSNSASTTTATNSMVNNPSSFTTPAVPYMMYGQPMYGSPFMYQAMSPQVSYPMQQTSHSMAYSNSMLPLGLSAGNFNEPDMSLKPNKMLGAWPNKKQGESQEASSKTDMVDCADNNSTTKALKRESVAHNSLSENGKSTLYPSDIKSSTNYLSIKSTEAVTDNSGTGQLGHVSKITNRLCNNEETVDKTDGESSYSSFYSSFFKTESGSAEESGDAKKTVGRSNNGHDSSNYYQPETVKKVSKRKMEPPWLEQVCVTSELIYKYQILSKSMEEVLSADKAKMSTLKQPSLVNDQLGQLYLDLQLEGVAARLTLEEGITSSSSSGEENTNTSKSKIKAQRRKREHSKLGMIFEEDAPMPPPSSDADPIEDPEVAGTSY